ncbi:MAG: M23 family metallopeptidase [Paracoccaceae bacterium]
MLAAAPGEVRALRDGMPDLGLAGTPPDLLDGQECGNGVLIDHGNGWETQYCHLRAGSVAVAEGDRVERGDRIGLVGYSGHTEFPHVHLGVRHDGAVIDPFDSDGTRVCGADDGPDDDLWAAPPGYRAGGVVAAGLLTRCRTTTR